MCVVLLTVRGERLLLSLEIDPERKRPALAHARGYAWSHLDRKLPPSALPFVRALADALEALPGRATLARDAAIAEAATLAAMLEAGATLSLLRDIDAVQPIPGCPTSLRNGWPRGDDLWPADYELLGAMLGTRTLVKRETVDDAEAEDSVSWLVRGGLVARRTGPNGLIVLAATNDVDVDAAIDAEAALHASGTLGDDAARYLGGVLGYPACCVDAFLRLGRRDDRSLYATRLPELGVPPAPPETLWLPVPLRLVSHTPCSLRCESTRALGAALLDALDEEAPGYRARWLALATAVHAVDRRGRCFALTLDDDAHVGDAFLFDPSPGIALAEVMRPAPELRGAPTAVEGGALSFGTSSAALAADHRGARPA